MLLLLVAVAIASLCLPQSTTPALDDVVEEANAELAVALPLGNPASKVSIQHWKQGAAGSGQPWQQDRRAKSVDPQAPLV